MIKRKTDVAVTSFGHHVALLGALVPPTSFLLQTLVASFISFPLSIKSCYSNMLHHISLHRVYICFTIRSGDRGHRMWRVAPSGTTVLINILPPVMHHYTISHTHSHTRTRHTKSCCCQVSGCILALNLKTKLQRICDPF